MVATVLKGLAFGAGLDAFAFAFPFAFPLKIRHFGRHRAMG